MRLEISGLHAFSDILVRLITNRDTGYPRRLSSFQREYVRLVPCKCRYQLPDIIAIREGVQHNVEIVYCICKFPSILVGERKPLPWDSSVPPHPSPPPKCSQRANGHSILNSILSWGGGWRGWRGWGGSMSPLSPCWPHVGRGGGGEREVS
jgi:hypothetical protein